MVLNGMICTWLAQGFTWVHNDVRGSKLHRLSTLRGSPQTVCSPQGPDPPVLSYFSETRVMVPELVNNHDPHSACECATPLKCCAT